MKWCHELNMWKSDMDGQIDPDYCEYVCDGCEEVEAK